MLECQVNVGGDCGLCNYVNDCPAKCEICGKLREVDHDYFEDVCDDCGEKLHNTFQHYKDFECSLSDSLVVVFGKLQTKAKEYLAD